MEFAQWVQKLQKDSISIDELKNSYFVFHGESIPISTLASFEFQLDSTIIK